MYYPEGAEEGEGRLMLSRLSLPRCRTRIAMVTAWSCFIAGCSVDLPLWSFGEQISCSSREDCPDGSACDLDLGRCLRDGEVIDRAPPTFLTPSANARVDVGEIVIAWTEVLGADRYILDVSTTGDFSAPVSGSPFEVSATSATITADLPVTYYLRVRADVTAAGAATELTIHALRDAVFVYCPQTLAVCADDDTAFGNRSRPMRTIGGALALARSTGRSFVRVAARGDAIAYNETVKLEHGVALIGGYPPDFGQRDPALYPTIIASTNAVTVFADGGVTRADIAEFTGFKVVGSGFRGSSALTVFHGDATVAIHHNIFENTLPSDPSGTIPQAAVVIEGRFSLEDVPFVFANNDVRSNIRGIAIRETRTIVRDNVVSGVSGDPIFGLVGIDATSSPVDIRDNTLVLDGQSTGIRVQGSLPGGPLISTEPPAEPLPRVRDNIVDITSGRSTGIYLAADQRPRTVYGNQVRFASAVAPTGIYVEDGAASIEQNTIQVGSLSAVFDNPVTKPNIAAGIQVERPRPFSATDIMVVRANTITIPAFVSAGAYSDVPRATGIAVTYASVLPVNVVDNSVQVAVAANSGTPVSDAEYIGISVASQLPSAQPSQAAVSNNTVFVHGAGSGTGVVIEGLLQVIYVVNNLVLFDLADPAHNGITLDQWPSNLWGALSANAIIGADAFITPLGATARADLLACPALVHPLVGGTFDPASFATCAGNLSGPGPSESWTVDDLALAPSLAPTAGSPAALRVGGVDASPRQCGAVTSDAASRPRQCVGSSCYSIGAFEPVP